MGRRINPERYQEMWLAYLEVQSIKHVADTTGCHWNTAKKYVNVGEPPEFPALKARFREHMRNLNAQLDRDAVDVRAENLQLSDMLKHALLRRLSTQMEGYMVVQADPEAPEEIISCAPTKVSPRDVAEVLKVQELILGGKEAEVVRRMEAAVALVLQLLETELAIVHRQHGVPEDAVKRAAVRVAGKMDMIATGELLEV